MSAASSGETGADLQLGDEVELREVPIDEDGIRATVEKDDTRTLNTVGEGVEAWEEYLDAKENQMLVMEEEESGDHLVVPHEHRWSADYRRRTYARLKAAERHVTGKWGETVPTTMLTLTAPHKDASGDYRAFTSVLSDLKEGWNKARDVIARETEGVETEYLAVYEPHATGYPHLHVLVFGVARPSLGEKVAEYWVDRYVEGASREAQDVTVKRGRSLQLESPAAYLMKYLSKSLAREGSEGATDRQSLPSIAGYRGFSAMMWATGKRTYSMSEGLSEAVAESAPESEGADGTWKYVGTVSGVEAGLYTGEEAERLGKYLAGSANQRTPPRQGRDAHNGRVDGPGPARDPGQY